MKYRTATLSSSGFKTTAGRQTTSIAVKGEIYEKQATTLFFAVLFHVGRSADLSKSKLKPEFQPERPELCSNFEYQFESNGNEMTVRGCLSGSAGNYTLTSDSGTTYQLAGDTSKLADHVGHTVEIKGTTTSSSSSSSTGGSANSGSSTSGNSSGSSSGGAQQTLNMTSMKHISTSCNSSR